jgi:ribosomal protein S27AE
MTMDWKNLKDGKCPHCGEELFFNDENDMHSCVQCRFAITPEKFKLMKSVRKLKWQHLQENRCPACSNFLEKAPNGYYEILECSDKSCDFHIREDRLKAILQDQSHPANMYYKKLDDDIDANLSRLNNL